MSWSVRHSRIDVPPELEPLSKRLFTILRPTGPGDGLYMDYYGWCKLSDLMARNDLNAWTAEQIKFVLKHDWSRGQPRFELDKAEKWVRATRCHNFSSNETEATNHSSTATHACKNDASTQTPSQAPAFENATPAEHDFADGVIDVLHSSTHSTAPAHDESQYDAVGHRDGANSATPQPHFHDAAPMQAETDPVSVHAPQQFVEHLNPLMLI